MEVNQIRRLSRFIEKCLKEGQNEIFISRDAL